MGALSGGKDSLRNGEDLTLNIVPNIKSDKKIFLYFVIPALQTLGATQQITSFAEAKGLDAVNERMPPRRPLMVGVGGGNNKSNNNGDKTIRNSSNNGTSNKSADINLGKKIVKSATVRSTSSTTSKI